MSAGTHTLSWAYQKDPLCPEPSTEPLCAPSQGVEDAAWIDDLVVTGVDDAVWESIGTTAAGATSIPWTVPNLATAAAKIQVCQDTGGSCIAEASDESDRNFSIGRVKITETGGSTQVAEGGATDTYSIVLLAQPSAEVFVTVATDLQVSVSPSSLVFTPDNWSSPQTVTVLAIDDDRVEEPHVETLRHLATSGDPNFDRTPVASVVVQVVDNDVCPPANAAGFMAYASSFTGGVYVAVGDVDGNGCDDVVTGAGEGGGPHVRVFGADGSLLTEFFAYHPSFTGGVRVAVGDVDGKLGDDIITAPGPGGGPHVQVFSGKDLSVLASFFAYSPSFTGGVFVAAGDVNGDGKDDIITGAGAGGGPHVRAFSGADQSDLHSFFAYSPSFTGGVLVAGGDLNNDGRADIITGAGAGGGPHVRAFSGVDLSSFASFFAYSPSFTGGVFVAVGDVVPGSSNGEIVTGPGPGGGPHVRVFSGIGGAVLDEFFAYSPSFTGGVRVGAAGPDALGTGKIATGPGPGGGAPRPDLGIVAPLKPGFFTLR